MKTKYKHIHFEQRNVQGRKTASYTCLNTRSDAVLGYVEWYSPWRQYCFMPVSQIVFSADCLADIQNFIEQLKAERQAP